MNAPLTDLIAHAGWLRRLAVGLLRDGDAAEDVVQGTMIAAWNHPPATDRDVRPWLAEVMRNEVVDDRRSEGRRRARESAAVERAAAEGPATPEQLIGDLEIHRAVAEVVAALDEPYRSTLVLHYYESIPSVVIAQRQGVPPGTVRWRLKEGLERVRVALDRRHGERRRWRRALLPLLGRPPAPRRALPAAAASLALVTLVAGVAVWRPWRARPPAAASVSVGSRAERPTAGSPPPRFVPGAFILPGAGGSDPAALRANDLLRRLLNAVIDKDYEAAVSDATDLFKAVGSPDLFAEIEKNLATRLRAGYQVIPLGPLRQDEAQTFLYKVEFRDAGDDALLRLVVRDGRVAGFFQQ